jgi:hypothetical protein
MVGWRTDSTVERSDSASRLAGAPQGASNAITWRAITIGLALIPFSAWWLAQIEWVRYSDNATTSALFFHAVALLLLLLALNAAVKRIAPRWAFSRVELLVIYLMVTSASVLAGHDQLAILVAALTIVIGHATPENQWATQVHPLLPRRLVVTDPAAIGPLFKGASSLYSGGHWRAWIGPLGLWALFAIIIVWVMLCLASILRRQWDAERLNYPIAEVPLIMTSEGFYRQRLLWLAFFIGATPQLVNLLHIVAPQMPEIPVGGRYFPAPHPWNASPLLTIPVYLYPFIYGLAFLLPLQLMFSYLFFLLLSRVEVAAAVSYGAADWQKFPYVLQQGIGACFGLTLVVLWTARRHLRAVWHNLWGRARLDDADEAMSYRTAAIGVILGGLALVGFAVFAGMRPLTAILYLGILFVIVLTVARVRAELGLPTFELFLSGPDQVLQRVGGVRAWNRHELTAMSLFFWLTRTHRQFPMLAQVDALRIGRRTQMPLRGLAFVLMLASAVGIIAAFWAMLHVTYQIGYDSARFRGPAIWAFGLEPWVQLTHNLTDPAKRDIGAIGAYLFGAAFAVFLGAMRAGFLWWPFHPIGYMVSGSFGVFRLWLPIFVTWLIKGTLLRYGGLRAYRRALPFFIGLVLGEFSAGFLRTLIDLAFNLYLPPTSGIGGL